MADPPRTIDACEAILKAQHWSVADWSYVDQGKLVWAVQCHRGDNTRFGYGDTQLEAWQKAVALCRAY